MRTEIRTYSQASASQDPTRRPSCSFEGSASKGLFQTRKLASGLGYLGMLSAELLWLWYIQSQNLAFRSFLYNEQAPGTVVKC